MDPRGNGQLTLVDLGLVKDVSGPAGRLSTHPMALRERLAIWHRTSTVVGLVGPRHRVAWRKRWSTLEPTFTRSASSSTRCSPAFHRIRTARTHRLSCMRAQTTAPPLRRESTGARDRWLGGADLSMHVSQPGRPTEDAAAFIRELDALNAAPIDRNRGLSSCRTRPMRRNRSPRVLAIARRFIRRLRTRRHGVQMGSIRRQP